MNIVIYYLLLWAKPEDSYAAESCISYSTYVHLRMPCIAPPREDKMAYLTVVKPPLLVWKDILHLRCLAWGKSQLNLEDLTVDPPWEEDSLWDSLLLLPPPAPPPPHRRQVGHCELLNILPQT